MGVMVWIPTLLIIACVVPIIGSLTGNEDITKTIAIPLFIAAYVPLLHFAVLIALVIITLLLQCFCAPFLLLFEVCTTPWKENKEEKKPLINNKKKKKSDAYNIV